MFHNRKLMLGGVQRQFVAVAAFTPASLSPNLWIEPGRGGLFQSNAGTTAATANADVVGFLPDQSGNSFTLTSVADDTTRPTLQGVGVFPYLSFDGSNDMLRRTAAMSAYGSASGFTWAVVIRSASNAAGTRLVAEGNSAQSNTIIAPIQAETSTATSSAAFYRNDAGATTGASSPSGSTPLNANVFNASDKVFIYTDDGTSSSSTSNIATYINGVAGSTVSFTRNGSAVTTDRFALGALLRNVTTGANFWAGRVYGGVFVNRVITSGERASLTTYLGNLAGLSL